MLSPQTARCRACWLESGVGIVGSSMMWVSPQYNILLYGNTLRRPLIFFVIIEPFVGHSARDSGAQLCADGRACQDLQASCCKTSCASVIVRQEGGQDSYRPAAASQCPDPSYLTGSMAASTDQARSQRNPWHVSAYRLNQKIGILHNHLHPIVVHKGKRYMYGHES
jgi:hypothetical protein